MISKRLLAASEFVREGSVLADIGTDHAFLPIYLVTSGRARAAIASDISSGSLSKARANIEKAGCSDRITTVLSDGLEKVMDFRPSDIVVFGMGGETIIRILSACPGILNSSLRLILGPQSFVPDLRSYLHENGFGIIGESICRERGRFYNCIAAEFGIEEPSYSGAELILGRKNIESRSSLLREYTAHEINVLSVKAQGLSSSGRDSSDIIAQIDSLKKYAE